ncbi:MAG: TonB-dependent receptor [Cellvibrionaceae bacterium]
MPYSKNKLCLALLAASAAATSVQAQNSDFMLEEIVVTAEKREANLQDTAIAVTALDAGMLERSNIEDSLDLQFAVPNLMVGQNSNITLRGVGQSVLGGGADPAVSSSFNSMPIAPTGENYDLERIEVLRGPQGTLFGRNTTGGVINTLSATPTEEFSVDVTAQVANFGSTRTKGAINLPIADSIYQRFAFNTVNRDGYTENTFNNSDIDGRDELSVRSSTRFEFGDTADATLVVQYYKEDSDRQSSTKVACKPDATIGCAPDTGDTIGYPADYMGSVDDALFGFGVLKFNRYADNPNPSDLREVSIDVNPEYELEETYVGLEVNFNLTDELTLTSATAYLKNDFNQYRDFDLAAAPDAFNVTLLTPTGELTYLIDGEFETTSDYSPTQRNMREREEYSQEFRLASDYAGDLNFLAGISYTRSDTSFWGASYLPGLHNSANPAVTGGFTNESDLESKSTAVFGELYYDISENLTLTAGLRYTEDEKESVAGTNPFGDVVNPVTGEDDWEEVTGKINLNWNLDVSFTDATMIYGTLSRGYKGGGLNPGNTFAPTFDPEYIDSIEVGTKNTLLDNRMQLNAAAFFYDYSDYQVGGLINGAGANFNAEEVKVQGLELEGVYLITENLLVNASASFLDTEIVSSDPLPNTSLGSVGGIPILEDVEGNDLPNAPEMSFNLGVQYTQSLNDDLELRYRADYYWQDQYQGREFDNYTYDSWDRTDLYVTLSETSGRWEVEAFVKNVTDDDGITGGSAEASLVGLFRKLRLLDPRTYGVEFTYHWD